MEIVDLEKYIADCKERMEVIITPARARQVLADLSAKGKPIALDFETTALSPEDGRVRLTALFDPDTHTPYVIDHFMDRKMIFNHMVGEYAMGLWLVYNAKFEQRWFDYKLPAQVKTLDVDYYCKAVLGGRASSLAKMVSAAFKVDLSKELQNSGWHIPNLTTAQYEYAAEDAIWTFLLGQYWLEESQKHPQVDMIRAVHDFNDAVRPTIECEDTGIGLDPEYHQLNIDRWAMKAENCLRQIRRLVPKSALDNLNSKVQVSRFLENNLGDSALAIWPVTASGKQRKIDRTTLQMFAKKLPYPMSRFLNALALLQFYQKYLSTYGQTLITIFEGAGKVNYRLNIAQAATGRYSSSGINIQNIPRAAFVRNAFLPPEPFTTFVTADYSSIEVRVLAELSGDEKLLYDVIHGDVHATMAAARMGIPVSEFSENYKAGRAGFSERRSRAKAGTFRLTYGAGAGAVADSMGSSVDDAEEFIRKWAATYPKAYGYRQLMYDQMMVAGFLPVAVGRQVYVRKPDREMPIAANYPIQGAAATVMNRAMYFVQEARDAVCDKDTIRMVSTVHDEIILATYDNHIDTAAQILKNGMRAGWLDVFPGTSTEHLVEVGTGKRWGECK